MAQKGMSTTLVIIVAAVVILVTALVILAIFGPAMGNFASITEARNFCASTYKVTCETVGTVPTTYDTTVMTVAGQRETCASLCGRTAAEVCINRVWQTTSCGTTSSPQ